MVRDEAILLQRFVASGDAGAFSEIVRRYASLVYSACLRILGDKETAADATQETFFQFLKNANTITQEGRRDYRLDPRLASPGRNVQSRR